MTDKDKKELLNSIAKPLLDLALLAKRLPSTGENDDDKLDNMIETLLKEVPTLKNEVFNTRLRIEHDKKTNTDKLVKDCFDYNNKLLGTHFLDFSNDINLTEQQKQDIEEICIGIHLESLEQGKNAEKWIGIQNNHDSNMKVCIGINTESGTDISFYNGRTGSWDMVDNQYSVVVDDNAVFDDKNNLIID